MSLSAHRAVEFVVGLVLALTPFILAVTDLLDARAAATLIAGVLGIALITLAIAATREGTAMAPQGHAGLDRILVGLLLVAGVGLALAGDGVVGALCVGAAAIQMGILFATRYEEPAPDVSAGTTTTTT